MSERYPTTTDEQVAAAATAAAEAVRAGELIVLPTDTVYGIGCDAFSPAAVRDLLEAKGRDRAVPPPVLIGSLATLDALARDLSDQARALVAEFWPGPLTLVCREQPSLQWDLGENRGTVAIRLPDDPIARRILELTGPLAVSSANRTGHPPAIDADQAEEVFGDTVAVIVDGGPSALGEASTIVDLTGDHPRVLRAGAVALTVMNDLMDRMGYQPVEEG